VHKGHKDHKKEDFLSLIFCEATPKKATGKSPTFDLAIEYDKSERKRLIGHGD
jgi:hypothetical protein